MLKDHYLTVADEVWDRVREERKTNPKLATATAGDILNAIFARDPGLYNRYRNESGSGVVLGASHAVHGQRSRITVELMQDSADRFEAIVLAKQADGMSPGDAWAAAAKEEPDAYRHYVQMSSLRRDGSPMAWRR